MSMKIPDKAFVLAAGFGTRMKPLTDSIPKPLVKIGGETLLDRTLDQLAEAGIKSAVVNTHHLASHIESAVQGRTKPVIQLSHEDVLLDTGGGIKQALPFFMNDPFFVLAGDGYWTDPDGSRALERLAAFWNPQVMDILMLLQPVATMKLTHGVGDYDLDAENRASRSRTQAGTHMFTSIRLNHPRIFEATPDGAFSYLDLLDRVEAQGRLFGLVHDGDWHHISTPTDLAAVARTRS